MFIVDIIIVYQPYNRLPLDNEFWSGDSVSVNVVQDALRPGGVTIFEGRLAEAGCE
jgi:hypothetical protein